jgi:hypothetical protein
MGDDAITVGRYNTKDMPKEKLMKVYRIFFAIAILVLASLACQAVTGGRSDNGNRVPSSDDNGTESQSVSPTAASDDSNNDDSNANPSADSKFPMTADAENVVEVSNESIVYYTKLSPEEIVEFYRKEYTARGYTEREIVTSTEGGIVNLVFDGDPSGKAVVIQSVGLPDGTRTVAIRLEAS